MDHKFMVNYSIEALLLLLMTFLTSYPNAQGHMRGPHHPRNSPKVQSPPSPGHNHYMPRAVPGEPTPVLTHDKNILHDKQHIKEDLGDWVVADGKDMTDQELEFHYFTMHDFDNNSMLDGLEILQAISHVMPDDGRRGDVDFTGTTNTANKQKREVLREDEDKVPQMDDDFNYYIELIDRVLEEDDLNKDGYLSYFEYAVGRRRDDKREKALHSSNPSQI